MAILGDLESYPLRSAHDNPRPPERWKRMPLKMKLPHEELTTKQVIQHMRDAIHREEW